MSTTQRGVAPTSEAIRSSPGHRVGFTLLEISTVIAIMGIMAGIGYGGYHRYRLHAMTAEVELNLHAIASLLRARVNGPIACEAQPAEVPSGTVGTWVLSSCFDEIGFSPGVETRFQYQVDVEGVGRAASFVVTARGDLDGDGVTSQFTLRSDRLAIEVERRLE